MLVRFCNKLTLMASSGGECVGRIPRVLGTVSGLKFVRCWLFLELPRSDGAARASSINYQHPHRPAPLISSNSIEVAKYYSLDNDVKEYLFPTATYRCESPNYIPNFDSMISKL